MWEKLRQYFAGRGLHDVDLHREDMRLYYTSQGTSVNAVWMIDDAALAELGAEKYRQNLATIRGIFEKQGFRLVTVLTLFVTSQTAAARAIGEGSAFWIVDESYGRLLVYENQPEDYLGIRSVIENNIHFGGHSRNAEGAQIDLSHDNLRSESKVQPITRGASMSVSGDRGAAYREAAARASRAKSSKRWGRYSNLCIVTIVIALINLVLFLLVDLFGRVEILVGGQMSWYSVVEEGEYYRLLTCMFLHYGVDHFAGNMIALFAFGDLIERRMTRVKYILLYLLSGLGASAFSCLFYHYVEENDLVVSAGASGAIYGLMGAMLALLIRYKALRSREYGTRFGIFVAYLIYSFVRAGESVNVAAHFGGFALGVILFWIFDRKKSKRLSNWQKKVQG